VPDSLKIFLLAIAIFDDLGAILIIALFYSQSLNLLPLIGKPIGIMSSSYLLVKSKLVKLPEQCSWWHVYGVSVLAGIGFTMSLFIGTLAFSDIEMHIQIKIGVISGSIMSGLLGLLILKSIKK